jgi:hypothetical protein
LRAAERVSHLSRVDIDLLFPHVDQTATNTAATAKDDDEQDEADSEAESTDANLTLSPNAVFNY